MIDCWIVRYPKTHNVQTTYRPPENIYRPSTTYWPLHNHKQYQPHIDHFTISSLFPPTCNQKGRLQPSGWGWGWGWWPSPGLWGTWVIVAVADAISFPNFHSPPVRFPSCDSWREFQLHEDCDRHLIMLFSLFGLRATRTRSRLFPRTFLDEGIL